MKQYLSGLGRGAALLDSRVQILRPAADALAASDFVLGTFRVGSAQYEFAVSTATGEIFTSERLAEFQDCCTRRIAAQLGLQDCEYTAYCLMELYAPAWQEEKSEWPYERAYLGALIPAGVTDMDAYAAQAISDGNVRILLYLACRSSELREGRWSAEALSDWDAVEADLFGFAEDEALPSLDTFPRDYHYATDRPRMTLSSTQIRYSPANTEGS